MEGNDAAPAAAFAHLVRPECTDHILNLRPNLPFRERYSLIEPRCNFLTWIGSGRTKTRGHQGLIGRWWLVKECMNSCYSKIIKVISCTVAPALVMFAIP